MGLLSNLNRLNPFRIVDETLDAQTKEKVGIAVTELFRGLEAAAPRIAELSSGEPVEIVMEHRIRIQIVAAKQGQP